MDNEIKPLAGDPKRQASGDYRGYLYQAWQSLYAWIKLSGDEVLYFEGAEDIDQLSHTSASTIQVKLVSKNINLNSSEIKEAISNYWVLKTKEKRRVTLDVLTNAPRGKEQGNYFNGDKGLDYWDKCRGGADIEPLKIFLQQLQGLPIELIEFIKTNSDQKIKEELIFPIQFRTEQENLDQIIQAVEDELIIIGNFKNIPVDESKKISSVLFTNLIAVLCKKNANERKLSKADFLKAYDDITRVSLTRAEFHVLQQQAQYKAGLLSSWNFIPANQGGNFIDSQIQKPYAISKTRFIFRSTLANEIISHLQSNCLVSIIGSSGMGKSTMAFQVIENTKTDWHLVNFRGNDGKTINNLLNGLTDFKLFEQKNILLNDINFDSDYKIYSLAFEKFVALAIENRKKVIITSQRAIPLDIQSNLGLSHSNEFQVKEFNDNEIKELLKLFSCPLGDIEFWVKDLKLTTNSHPLLLHVRVNKLKANNWEKSLAIFQTGELTSVKQEVLRNLISDVPSEEARDLLLRLSILSGSFKEKNALSLVNFPTKIHTPSVYFNQLIGTYVEQISESRYSLSPLLGSAFIGNFTEDQNKALHYLAGESFVSKTLTPSDLSNIFYHGIAGKSGKLMYYAFAAFQSIEDKHKKLIYPYLEWLIPITAGAKGAVFENDEVMGFMFRHIQFNIAIELNDRFALTIADQWFEETKKFTGKGPFNKEKETKTVPFMFYVDVLKSDSLLLTLSRCVDWIISAHNFLDANPEMDAILRQPASGEKFTWKEIIVEVALTKRINSSTLSDFMQAILKNKENGTTLLGYIDSQTTLPRTIVDSTWLDQIDNKTPNWSTALGLLDTLKQFAIDKQATNMAAYAIRAIAIIKNEYIGNKKEAINELTQGVNLLGQHPELVSYKAKIAFIEHDYKTSLDIWKTVIPKLSKDAGVSNAFIYRDAAVSAANLNDWVAASKYFELGVNYAKKGNEKIFETQLLAEYGFSLWKLDRKSDALIVFGKVISAFSNLPDPRSNLRLLGLMKMTANALIYIRKSVNPEYKDTGIAFTEPVPGLFSQLEFSEKLKDLPYSQPSSLWIFVAEIEHELNLGDNAFQQIKKLFPKLSVLFQTEVKKLEVCKAIRSKNIISVISELVHFFTYMNISINAENRNELVRLINGDDTKEAIKKYSSVLTQFIAYSFIMYLPINDFKKIPVDEVENQGIKYGLSETSEWSIFIDFIKSIDLTSARRSVNDGSLDRSIRIVAAIYILTHDDDRDSVLAASIMLVLNSNKYFFFHRDMRKNIEKNISEKWIVIASGLFSIYHDEESSSVLDVCNNNKISGLNKAAQIILKAKEISFIRIENVVKEISTLIDSDE